MNSAPSADNAENRSLKSGFVAIFAPDRALLVYHLPSGGEDPLRAHLLPELDVEGAIVPLPAPQDAAHDHASLHGSTLPRPRPRRPSSASPPRASAGTDPSHWCIAVLVKTAGLISRGGS